MKKIRKKTPALRRFVQILVRPHPAGYGWVQLRRIAPFANSISICSDEAKALGLSMKPGDPDIILLLELPSKKKRGAK